MKSPFCFVAKPVGDRYNNTKEISGVEFIVNTSEEDHRFSNRYAEVVQVPIENFYNIQIGDILLVHHNVFKFYNDMKGRRKSGASFFRDDYFLIEHEQVFMYKRDGEWNSVGRHSFVKPVEPKGMFLFTGAEYEPLMGEMVYPSEYTLSQDIKKGDLINFAPESEYEFDVDDQLMYRIMDRHITMHRNELQES